MGSLWCSCDVDVAYLRQSDWTRLQWSIAAADESIFCREGWRHGLFSNYFESCLFCCLISGELSKCWQSVKSAVVGSYPVCLIRLSVLSGLLPFLSSRSDVPEDSGEAVTQSTAVSDLCLICAQSLIGSDNDNADDFCVISTMRQALVIVYPFI